MKPDNLATEKSGKLIRGASDYWAFIPAPLPPEIDLGPLVWLLSEADAAVGEMSGIGRFLPNPDLLISPYVRREAVASSRIEGTQAGLSDLLFAELESGRMSPGSDVIEVRNYVAALKMGVEWIKEIPISGRLVRELHARLMRGVRGQDRTPGEYRRLQNWIGSSGSTIAEAVYVPPPVPDMIKCLDDWERFANETGKMPDLVQCALIHEHFEAIHPFSDGNGRVGRLLIPLFLIARGRLSRPLLYVSGYFEQHRSTYYELLQRIRTHGDWHAWLTFFLTAIRDTARNAIRQGELILELRERLREQLRGDHTAMALVDLLFESPAINMKLAAARLQKSEPTAAKTVRQLEAAGLLRELTGRQRGRIWVCDKILRIAETTDFSSP